ncbi:hypothetical protein [Hyphomicrobium sp.]|uniref:hypothetical protein n=1 Tax=Hyphomicrobium sp. TaxID=82 RepID=UPI002FE0EF39
MAAPLHIMTAIRSRRARPLRCAAGLAAVLAVAGGAAHAAAPTLPEIRLSAKNGVPQCVTPDRLMAFLKQRNGKLDPRFRNIASFYRQHGEAWAVRWDYAFFQMAIETNFLTYRAPSGRMGDVDPRQNNFAGIGTTGGGVPGDSFPDVSTGVLGQIQHLVVYSGEPVAEPVAPRTRLKQDHILAKSHELKRPVRFSDLAGRWAADRKYAGSIEWVATRFRAEYCAGRAGQAAEVLPWQGAGSRPSAGAALAAPVKAVSSWEQEAPGPKPQKAKAPPPAKMTAPKPARAAAQPVPVPAAPMATAPAADEPAPFRLFAPPAGLAEARIESAPRAASAADEAPGPAGAAPGAVSGKTVAGFMIGGVGKPDYPPPSGLGVKPGRCVIETARYGGETTVLVKAPEGPDVHYVALSVLDGFEASMTQTFLDSRPEGGEVLGTFVSRDHAMARARALCPD